MLEQAQAIASLTALISIWINERRNRRPGSTDEFREWLSDHNFGDFVQRLDEQSDLFDQLAQLVDLRADELLGKLNEIQELQVRVFEQLEMTVGESDTLTLSDQAVSIIIQMFKSGKSEFMDIKSLRNRRFTASGGPALEITELDHLDEDLEVLCLTGLLRDREGSQGHCTFYTITRAGKTRAKQWIDEQ